MGTACVDAGGFDAGGFEAGGLEAGGFDAGALDAGGLDAGGVEAGGLDGAASGVLLAAIELSRTPKSGVEDGGGDDTCVCADGCADDTGCGDGVSEAGVFTADVVCGGGLGGVGDGSGDVTSAAASKEVLVSVKKLAVLTLVAGAAHVRRVQTVPLKAPTPCVWPSG